MIKYTCPHCAMSAEEENPVQMKEAYTLKFICKCQACQKTTIIVLSAFYELTNRSLKKLHLEKFYPS